MDIKSENNVIYKVKNFMWYKYDKNKKLLNISKLKEKLTETNFQKILYIYNTSTVSKIL